MTGHSMAKLDISKTDRMTAEFWPGTDALHAKLQWIALIWHSRCRGNHNRITSAADAW